VLADDAYAHLVGIFATGANRPLVAPGDPDGSYVLNKVDGSFDDPEVNGSGSRMPLAMDMLSDAEIELIRTWIEQGAAP
jgi:mono/diheme cytochrome c family protein